MWPNEKSKMQNRVYIRLLVFSQRVMYTRTYTLKYRDAGGPERYQVWEGQGGFTCIGF